MISSSPIARFEVFNRKTWTLKLAGNKKLKCFQFKLVLWLLSILLPCGKVVIKAKVEWALTRSLAVADKGPVNYILYISQLHKQLRE